MRLGECVSVPIISNLTRKMEPVDIQTLHLHSMNGAKITFFCILWSRKLGEATGFYISNYLYNSPSCRICVLVWIILFRLFFNFLYLVSLYRTTTLSSLNKLLQSRLPITSEMAFPVHFSSYFNVMICYLYRLHALLQNKMIHRCVILISSFPGPCVIELGFTDGPSHRLSPILMSFYIFSSLWLF